MKTFSSRRRSTWKCWARTRTWASTALFSVTSSWTSWAIDRWTARAWISNHFLFNL